MFREELKTRSGENRPNTKYSGERTPEKTRKGKTMATIKDTIKLDNYDTMTAEEKVAAYEAAEIPEPDYTGYVQKSLFDKKTSDLAAANRRIKDLEGAQKSDAERLADDRKAFEDEKAQFNRERNGMTVRNIFTQNGLKPEDYADFDVDSFDDADKATKFANSIVKMAKAQRSAAEQTVRGSLLGGDTPPQGGATPTEATTIRQQYADAVKSGNTMAMARAIRTAQEKGVSLNY